VPYSLSIKELLESGAHYGHERRRWAPAMKPFIYGERNGIHIINLALTSLYAEEAYNAIVETVAEGGDVLFVGTKPQAREPLREESLRAKQYFMVNRWLGGTLTNFRTIRKSLEKLARYEEMEAEGILAQMTKKEALKINRERDKLLADLEGVVDMKRLPSAMFVVDVSQDAIAVKEANRLGIPVVGLCDSNSDPKQVDYPIPANDDAVRAIRLFAGMIADACIEGEAQRQARLSGEDDEAHGERSLAEQFIDAEEEDELLTMRRVIRKVGKKGETLEAEGEQAADGEANPDEAADGAGGDAQAQTNADDEQAFAARTEKKQPEADDGADAQADAGDNDDTQTQAAADAGETTAEAANEDK